MKFLTFLFHAIFHLQSSIPAYIEHCINLEHDPMRQNVTSVKCAAITGAASTRAPNFITARNGVAQLETFPIFPSSLWHEKTTWTRLGQRPGRNQTCAGWTPRCQIKILLTTIKIWIAFRYSYCCTTHNKCPAMYLCYITCCIACYTTYAFDVIYHTFPLHNIPLYNTSKAQVI
jgi:hypothetical protein